MSDMVVRADTFTRELYGTLLTSGNSFKFAQILHTNETAVQDAEGELFAYIKYTDASTPSNTFSDPLFVGDGTGAGGLADPYAGALSIRSGVTQMSEFTATSLGSSGYGKRVTIHPNISCDAYQPPPTVHKYCGTSNGSTPMASLSLAGQNTGDASCTGTSGVVASYSVPILATCGRFGVYTSPDGAVSYTANEPYCYHPAQQWQCSHSNELCHCPRTTGSLGYDCLTPGPGCTARTCE